MKKVSLILFVISLFVGNQSKADEGMWLPLLVNRLNYTDMQKSGLQLTAEEIYSINNSSLKDAIVLLNGGMCTGYMISGEGLMMTNHHCGFEFIQKLSTVENDLVDNGFWAKSKAEELRNEKLYASFLVRVENLSDKILSQLNPAMSELDRAKKVKELSDKYIAEATSGTDFNAEVKSFFNGNEYYLFVYETYKDVRLVGAPSKSIGNFGADSDNWLWPRHTADFSMFRIYMSPQNRPSEYNKKNIPFVPKSFTPISTKGLQKDDFTMVMGYPNTTDRYMASYGVKHILDQIAPTFVNVRAEKMKIYKEDMDKSPEVRIQYISKYNDCSNYWKYFIGQKDVLTKMKVFEKKQELEKQFAQWLDKNTQAKAKYGQALPILEKAYQDIAKYNLSKYYFAEVVKRGVEILSYAHEFVELYNELSASSPNQERINMLATSFKYKATKYFKSYNAETDKKVFIALMTMYYNNIDKSQHPDVFLSVDKKFKGDIGKWAADLFEKSIFSNKDRIQEFLSQPSSKILDKDPGYKAMESFYKKHDEIDLLMQPAQLELEKGNRMFIAGLMEMQKDKKFYPNANNTLRLSYGKVCDYSKPEGQKLPYFSTIDQMVARNKPNDPEFSLPSKFIDMVNAKDFGRWGVNNTLNTCFITNNDITGGNSGAPVLNAKGQLVGIVFDLNWEGTASPVVFEPEFERSVCVDIRYILWIVDKYAGASNLINELKIVE